MVVCTFKSLKCLSLADLRMARPGCPNSRGPMMCYTPNAKYATIVSLASLEICFYKQDWLRIWHKPAKNTEYKTNYNRQQLCRTHNKFLQRGLYF